MKKFKSIMIIMFALMMLSTVFLTGCDLRGIFEDSEEMGKPTFDENIEITIGTIAQVGLEDQLYDYIAEKFNVHIEYQMFDYNMWSEQLNGMINGGDMIDLIEWDMRPYLAATYQDWIAGEVLKPLPTDLKYFPNLAASLNDIAATEHMKGKNDGKLYCVPLRHGIDETEDGFLVSDMHYIYRRDWAKEAGLYKEGDIYTFDEMVELLQAFKQRGSNIKPFADVPWGIPSIANYYVTEPGLYMKDNTGKYAWKFNQDSYMTGLNFVKDLKDDELYNIDFYSDSESDLFNDYKGNAIGIYYNNYTLANLYNIREAMATTNPSMTEADIREATAAFYLVDKQGKVANDSMENWWSVMLFNSGMSNKKMARILSIMDWMLSDEGLYTCAYGIKDKDWSIDNDGKVTVLWEKDGNGDYIEKDLNSQNLRWIVSTCSDMAYLNPLIPQTLKDDYMQYRNTMNSLKEQGKLNFLDMDREMQWLSSPNKDNYIGSFRTGTQAAITQYIAGSTNSLNKYYSENQKTINKVLDEINTALGL